MMTINFFDSITFIWIGLFLAVIFVPYIVFPLRIRKLRNLLLESKKGRLTDWQYSYLNAVFQFNSQISDYLDQFVLMIGMIEDDCEYLFSRLMEEVKKCGETFKDPLILLKKHQLIFDLLKKDFFVLLTTDKKMELAFLPFEMVSFFLNLDDKSDDPEELAKKISCLLRLLIFKWFKRSIPGNQFEFLKAPLGFLEDIAVDGGVIRFSLSSEDFILTDSCFGVNAVNGRPYGFLIFFDGKKELAINCF